MNADNSDGLEDAGRRESESLFKNKMSSKWLDDMIASTGLDYDEVVEHIERERKMIDNMETGFLDSLDLTMHDKAYGPAKGAHGPGISIRTVGNSSERISRVNNLLESSDQLLKLHQKAKRAIGDGVAGPGSCMTLEEEREKDKERTRQLLAVGKRVFERELSGIDQQATAKDFANVDSEVLAQANTLFGGCKTSGVESEVDKSLKYMQKGVRKMTKGLDSAM